MHIQPLLQQMSHYLHVNIFEEKDLSKYQVAIFYTIYFVVGPTTFLYVVYMLKHRRTPQNV